MWHRIRPVLAARYRTIAFDNRGAGRSDATAPHTLDVTIHHDDGRIHQRGIGDAVNYIGMHKEDRIIAGAEELSAPMDASKANRIRTVHPDRPIKRRHMIF